ncbi:unnamed protein product [Musa acuminata var. zebrina]
MVDLNQKDADGVELPYRAHHVIGPDKTIKLSFLYPAATGRNMDEVVREVDSLQTTANFKVATPVNWKPGEPVVISPSVSNEEAKVLFPQGYDTVDLPSKQFSSPTSDPSAAMVTVRPTHSLYTKKTPKTIRGAGIDATSTNASLSLSESCFSRTFALGLRQRETRQRKTARWWRLRVHRLQEIYASAVILIYLYFNQSLEWIP